MAYEKSKFEMSYTCIVGPLKIKFPHSYDNNCNHPR